MEVLSYPEMKKIGELNLSEHPDGRNVWPAIIPLTTDTGTAYYLLTFDRIASTQFPAKFACLNLEGTQLKTEKIWIEQEQIGNLL
jgi:hypothetical protein